jgi:hypothetical protein
MTRHFADRSIRLNDGELLDINDGEGFRVACLEGAVWLTQSNDPRDIVLHTGQSFVLDKSGLALVCAAAGPATVALEVSLRQLRRGAIAAGGTPRPFDCGVSGQTDRPGVVR